MNSPGEFHPEALAEPDVRLAPHAAPVTQPRAERYASERTTAERVPSSCRAIAHYAAFAAVVSCICVWPTAQASGLYSGRTFASTTYMKPHSSSTTSSKFSEPWKFARHHTIHIGRWKSMEQK